MSFIPFESDFGFNIFHSISLFEIIFSIMFITILGIIIFNAAKGVKQWNYNNHQPILTVDARIVTKRADVSTHYNHSDNHMHHHSDTTYFITFEVESGSRMEFVVHSYEYGMLVEGDLGKLTFQGTRFLGFKRQF